MSSRQGPSPSPVKCVVELDLIVAHTVVRVHQISSPAIRQIPDLRYGPEDVPRPRYVAIANDLYEIIYRIVIAHCSSNAQQSVLDNASEDAHSVGVWPTFRSLPQDLPFDK